MSARRRAAAVQIAVLGGLVLWLVSACSGEGEPPAADAGRQIAAAVPNNDIWLAPIEVTDVAVSVGLPSNITAKVGYQNQPAFADDGSGFWYSAIGSDEQADVWWYDLASQGHEKVTATPQSEYSPTLMPDGHRLSSVRVEIDGEQRLWAFEKTGVAVEALLPDITGVGYHAWLDDDRVALFIVGEPHTLHIASLASGSSRVVASDIGRALVPVPHRNALSFVDKRNPDAWTVSVLDLDTGQVQALINTRDGAEDFLWTPNATLLMAQGRQLYAWRADCDWQLVADFAETLPGDITRLAYSATAQRLAMVAAETAGDSDD